MKKMVSKEKMMMKEKRTVKEKLNMTGRKVMGGLMHREPGIDGILVSVGLCIIALLLCVVMKDSLTEFIQTIVTALQTKASAILTGV